LGLPRLLRPLAAALLALGLAGCLGYVRPLVLQDGRNLYLVLAAFPLDQEEDLRTIIFLNRSGGAGPWVRLADRTGLVRAAAAWQNELWFFYPTTCAALRLEGADLAARIVPFEPGWEVQAAAVHDGALWALGLRSQTPGAGQGRLVAACRRPGGQDWEAVPGELLLGGSAVQMRAASSGGHLWLLWRKRAADGQLFPETFSACWRDGRWTLGPAREIGPQQFALVPEPGGAGVLIAIAHPTGPRWLGARPELLLYRLDQSGWSGPQPLGLTPSEFGAALLAPGFLGRPGAAEGSAAEFLAFAGRRGAVAVFESKADASGRPGPWREAARLELDLTGLEVLVVPGLFLAALLVGAGLGMIAVRRRRLFPLPPGEARPASLVPRGAAWLADNLMLGLVFYTVVACCGPTLGSLWRSGGLLLMVVGANRLIFFVYAWVFESRWGATPGKLIFGLRVTDQSGRRPTAGAVLVRNLLRILDELVVFPLPGLVVMAASRRTRRLGDLAAGTVVTTARALAEVAEDRHRKSDRFGLPR